MIKATPSLRVIFEIMHDEPILIQDAAIGVQE
jgi:hypothetical protein